MHKYLINELIFLINLRDIYKIYDVLLENSIFVIYYSLIIF